MKHRVLHCAIIGCAVLLAVLKPLEAQKDGPIPQFSQYQADVYRGHTKSPREFHKAKDGLWWDEAGKPAFAPRVNFAGEYYLAAHSCGTCCRYYTLINLRTGAEINQVGMFDASEPTPTTKDGHTYIPVLFFKPDSRLVIVQYEFDECTAVEHNKCRQRYFLFEDGRFRSLSKTLQVCTREGQEPN
jgi:hypothetical protein